MRNKANGLEWIDKNNQRQVSWSYRYLKGKGEIQRDGQKPSHTELLSVGAKLHPLLIKRMRGAWLKYASRSIENKTKTQSFDLSLDTAKQLSSLAKNGKTNVRSVVISLISVAAGEAGSQKAWIKATKKDDKAALLRLKAEIAETRKHLDKTLRALCALEAQGAPIDPKKPGKETEDLYTQRRRDIEQDIKSEVGKAVGKRGRLSQFARALPREGWNYLQEAVPYAVKPEKQKPPLPAWGTSISASFIGLIQQDLHSDQAMYQYRSAMLTDGQPGAIKNQPIPKPKAPASEETIEKQADFRADKALEPECHQAGTRLEETNTSQATSSPAAINEPEQRSLAALDERPEWQKKRDSIIGRPKT
ncbi:hypothetical protein [Halopseudomonas pelagia]|uniref:Uncharacterized protein n=1 Tax=Halopseudomonas pelagia TaxID=553151 RepID=A0AA91U6Q1_9GAMM|nr:hypothetical protein [Halopseudomonas pelagia]PCD01458.1 hypothetical protein CO192_00100 [Halopseudomonas pelagia]QFY57010.1 hypothetical protein EAO82_11935 [Halopseudomonas pelagia]